MSLPEKGAEQLPNGECRWWGEGEGGCILQYLESMGHVLGQAELEAKNTSKGEVGEMECSKLLISKKKLARIWE